MKKAITSVAIGAIITMAGISQAHAWGPIDAFKKSSTTNVTQSAGGDARYQSQGKNSGGRDRWEIKSSFNRTDAHNISGGKNFNIGNLDTHAEQKGEFKDLGNGTAKNAKAGLSEWTNAGGFIGQNQTTGGQSLGDSVNTGNTYMGTDAMDSQNEAARIQAKKEVDLKTLEASRVRSGYVR